MLATRIDRVSKSSVLSGRVWSPMEGEHIARMSGKQFFWKQNQPQYFSYFVFLKKPLLTFAFQRPTNKQAVLAFPYHCRRPVASHYCHHITLRLGTCITTMASAFVCQFCAIVSSEPRQTFSFCFVFFLEAVVVCLQTQQQFRSLLLLRNSLCFLHAKTRKG